MTDDGDKKPRKAKKIDEENAKGVTDIRENQTPPPAQLAAWNRLWDILLSESKPKSDSGGDKKDGDA